MKKPLASFFSRNPCPAITSFALGFAVVFAVLGFAYNTQAQTGPPTTSGKVVKWDQPPVLATPTNVFYGWNEYSVYGGSQNPPHDLGFPTPHTPLKKPSVGSFPRPKHNHPHSLLAPAFPPPLLYEVPH